MERNTSFSNRQLQPFDQLQLHRTASPYGSRCASAIAASLPFRIQFSRQTVPLPVVVFTRETPVVTRVNFTLAPGITASLASVTRPPKDVVACARRRQGVTSRTSVQRTQWRNTLKRMTACLRKRKSGSQSSHCYRSQVGSMTQCQGRWPVIPDHRAPQTGKARILPCRSKSSVHTGLREVCDSDEAGSSSYF
jgi:hypothetical protein